MKNCVLLVVILFLSNTNAQRSKAEIVFSNNDKIIGYIGSIGQYSEKLKLWKEEKGGKPEKIDLGEVIEIRYLNNDPNEAPSTFYKRNSVVLVYAGKIKNLNENGFFLRIHSDNNLEMYEALELKSVDSSYGPINVMYDNFYLALPGDNTIYYTFFNNSSKRLLYSLNKKITPVLGHLYEEKCPGITEKSEATKYRAKTVNDQIIQVVTESCQ